jgi:hypothetical protein
MCRPSMTCKLQQMISIHDVCNCGYSRPCFNLSHVEIPCFLLIIYIYIKVFSLLIKEYIQGLASAYVDAHNSASSTVPNQRKRVLICCCNAIDHAKSVHIRICSSLFDLKNSFQETIMTINKVYINHHVPPLKTTAKEERV